MNKVLPIYYLIESSRFFFRNRVITRLKTTTSSLHFFHIRFNEHHMVTRVLYYKFLLDCPFCHAIPYSI